MNTFAAEKIAQESYELGSGAALEKLSSPAFLRRLLNPAQPPMLTGNLLGYGGLEGYVVGKMVHNANSDLNKLVRAIKARK